MQTLSSARRTCMALLSAVECTATVRMPISRQARWMRNAISPRLAMSTFSNIAADLLQHEQRLTVFDGRAVGDEDLRHPASARRRDLVHHLHRLDDEQGLALAHGIPDLDKGRRLRLRREIGGADHGRLERAGEISGGDRRSG